MAEKDKPIRGSQDMRQPPEPPKMIWIETAATQDNSRKQSVDIDEDFKKQHQQYLALKRQRQQEEKRLKIKQFGNSSSEDDDDLLPHTSAKVPTQKYEEYNISMSKVETPKLKNVESFRTKQSKGHKEEKEGGLTVNDSFKIVMSSKKGDTWMPDKLLVTEQTLVLPSVECAYYDINKLKLIFTEVSERCFKIKVSWKNEQFIFGASHQAIRGDRHEVFLIFAATIQRKLSLMGRKPNAHPDFKSHGMPESLLKDSMIQGRLLKKSRVISRWTEVAVVINKQGLFYFKKGDEKGELLVPRGSIEQVWTRFEFQNEWLVVKLFQDGHKIELGIPMLDETVTKGWLFHLYGLFFKTT